MHINDDMDVGTRKNVMPMLVQTLIHNRKFQWEGTSMVKYTGKNILVC